VTSMPVAANAPHRLRQSPRVLAQFMIAILIVAMLAGFSMLEPNVRSPRNLLNIAVQASYLAIFATAQMLVILTRGFDLSLGSCVSAVSVVAALVMTGTGLGADAPPGLLIAAGLAAGLGTGLAVGLFNGICTTWLRVNPFIVTLGSLNIAFGVASIVSDGRPVFDLPEAFSALVYGPGPAGIPIPLIIAVALCLLVHVIATYTVFGRSLYLIGGNPRAAAVAGVATRRTLVLAYVGASLLAAVGAIMLTGRTGSGEPNLGGSLLLPSIAAAVIGGLSLLGGIGKVAHAVLGALFIAVLSNGMNLVRVDGYVQDIVLGAVIVFAVFLDRFRAARI